MVPWENWQCLSHRFEHPWAHLTVKLAEAGQEFVLSLAPGVRRLSWLVLLGPQGRSAVSTAKIWDVVPRPARSSAHTESRGVPQTNPPWNENFLLHAGTSGGNDRSDFHGWLCPLPAESPWTCHFHSLTYDFSICHMRIKDVCKVSNTGLDTW